MYLPLFIGVALVLQPGVDARKQAIMLIIAYLRLFLCEYVYSNQIVVRLIESDGISLFYECVFTDISILPIVTQAILLNKIFRIIKLKFKITKRN